jgi:DNA-binding NtrC family response regulator
MSHLPLSLLPFASLPDADALHALLESFGHVVLSTTLDDLMATPAHGFAPIVLLFGSEPFPRERLLEFLKRTPAPVCLGVALRDSVWDLEVLEFCSEFIAWPCSREELGLRLARIGRPIPHEAPLDQALLDEFAELNLIGQSSAFAQSLAQTKKLARYDVSVLIQGETGTGKELAARAIHYLGSRRDAPFVPVNCGAIPDNLLENELFGHERGAFTDAKEAQAGMVALAEGGTLFLDEIEALSPKGQVVLLRFLQDRTYRVLGGRRMQQANVRVIAAGNADLATLVKEGRFREDLYFRLNIGLLRLPALRERSGDARLLAEHFCRRYREQYRQPGKSLHPDSLRRLEQYEWPGNVRELENLIHRAFLFNEGDRVVLHDTLSPPAERRRNLLDRRGALLLRATLRHAKGQFVSEFEKRYLSALLAQTGGNVTLAARQAGTERRALGKLLKKHGIPTGRYRSP